MNLLQLPSKEQRIQQASSNPQFRWYGGRTGTGGGGQHDRLGGPAGQVVGGDRTGGGARQGTIKVGCAAEGVLLSVLSTQNKMKSFVSKLY